MPLYLRAGTVLPMGPVKQFVGETVAEPASLVVYPGANGASSLYEDDGRTFSYRQGAYMRIAMTWQDQTRTLTLRPTAGSRMLPPSPRPFTVRAAGSTDTQTVSYAGQTLTIRIP
jgi:alpha-glucosidase (family GH31 glycosyl hydrolase)